MALSSARDVKIHVAPYSDQSGYQAEARVYLDDSDEPVVEVITSYRIDPRAWAELRAAIDNALEFVRK